MTIAFSIGIRIYFIMCTEWYTAKIENDISKIMDVKYYIDNINIYWIMVSRLMALFDNSVWVIVWTNFFIQVVSIIMIFFIFKNLANELFSFFLSIFFIGWPWYIKKMFDVSDFCFTYFIKVLLIGIIAILYLLISYKLSSKKKIKGNDEEMKEITYDQIEQNEINHKKYEGAAVTTELTPPGMTEIKVDDDGNRKKEVVFIKNPLPVPKRKAHKKMDFVVELDDSNNDFDIKDITGMDFFDVD